MEDRIIHGKSYQLVTNYQHDQNLRSRFNKLTQKVYDFNFEKWYQSGYWEDNCLLYSLIDDHHIVSHITVTVIDFIVLGQQKKYVQLGTVMTDENYRNLGLARELMEKVLDEWKDKCDMIYLFANDDVLDFYPKFDFIPVNEYEASKRIAKMNSPFIVRKLDIRQISDRELLHQTAQQAVPLFKISMQNNAGLIMFYSNYFDLFSVKENLYYIDDLQTVVIAEHDQDTLIIYDILSIQQVDINDVIQAIARKRTKTVILGSMPINSEDYDISLFKEDDSTLFVLAKQSELFEKNQLCFPMLSHT